MVQRAESWALPSPRAEDAPGSPAERGDGAAERAPAAAEPALEAAGQRRPNRRLERTVAALVQFLLLKGGRQSPISRAEMLRVVRGDLEPAFDDILARAATKLRRDFGFDLQLLDLEQRTYALVNSPRAAGDQDQDLGAGSAKLGLLVVILGLIYMKGNCVREAQVWELLGRLGVWPLKYYQHFGYPKKLLTEEFVAQQFLNYRQVPSSSPPEYEFTWGLRSCQDISKMQVLSFVAKLQKKEPQHWPAQYREALADEACRERARAREEAFFTARARAAARHATRL
ncbi:melanoma-associated antigen F1 [Sorex fumeus]|uniref:melanoma-associated antigen F1 n=1 Tax=Sorex fumeus TaxID=62283 RepID=UPI0024AD20CD|nr:melanoma-associated antigen F1 [Sorex fumeus]